MDAKPSGCCRGMRSQQPDDRYRSLPVCGFRKAGTGIGDTGFIALRLAIFCCPGPERIAFTRQAGTRSVITVPFRCTISLQKIAWKILGCRQAVRHGVLISAFPGSNPGTPAIFIFHYQKKGLHGGTSGRQCQLSQNDGIYGQCKSRACQSHCQSSEHASWQGHRGQFQRWRNHGRDHGECARRRRFYRSANLRPYQHQPDGTHGHGRCHAQGLCLSHHHCNPVFRLCSPGSSPPFSTPKSSTRE